MTEIPDDPPWITNPDYFPTDDFARPLGEFLLAFGWLEAQLELVLLSLLGIHDEQARAILSFIGTFEGRRDLFSQLANLRVPTKSNEVAKLYSDLTEIGKRRNILIHGRHGGFSWPPLALGIARHDPRKQVFGQKSHFYTSEKLEDFKIHINDTAIALGKLRYEIIELLCFPKKTSENSVI